jgi:hypothetical protein
LLTDFVCAKSEADKKNIIYRACTIQVIINAEDAIVDDSTTSKKRKKPIATTSVSVLDNDLLKKFVQSFHYSKHATVFKFKMKDSFVTKDSVQQF